MPARRALRDRGAPRGTPWAAAITLLAACSAPAPPPPDVPVSGVRVQPVEVVGPVAQPAFVGRAVARSLAGRLGTVPDLRVLETTDPLEGDVATLTGEYRRANDRSCLEVRAVVADRDEPLWSVVRCSEIAPIPDLIDDVARGCVEALGREWPSSYPYIGRVEGGAEMRASPLIEEARDRFREGDLVGFAETARGLVDQFPSDPASHVIRAWSLTLLWDSSPSAEALSAVRDELDVLTRVDPASPYDDVMRAFVYRASGAPEQARSLYTQIIERDDLTSPARSWVLRQRSFTYSQTGQNEQARLDADEAVRLEPADAVALVALSRALEAVGDLEGALARSLEAVALEPGSWRHEQRVGIVAMRARSFDQAVDYLGRACTSSGNQESCANLAVALQRAGRSDEALEVATRAAERAPSRWGAYNLACLWALRGERGAALAALRDAVQLGFADVLITDDPDLDRLRGDPAFETEVENVLLRIRAQRSIASTVFPWQG